MQNQQSTLVSRTQTRVPGTRIPLSPVEMHHMNFSGVNLDLESLKESVSMTPYTREKLTRENFGPLPALPSASQTRFGGFYLPQTKDLSHIDCLKQDIIQLALQEKRTIRLGTVFELLIYMKLGLPCPIRYISIAKILKSEILYWCDYEFGTTFHLGHSRQIYRHDCGIFIMEEEEIPNTIP